jgi:hypothetical protein
VYLTNYGTEELSLPVDILPFPLEFKGRIKQQKGPSMVGVLQGARILPCSMQVRGVSYMPLMASEREFDIINRLLNELLDIANDTLTVIAWVLQDDSFWFNIVNSVNSSAFHIPW